jgi:hypothetical protein
MEIFDNGHINASVHTNDNGPTIAPQRMDIYEIVFYAWGASATPGIKQNATSV